MEDRMKNLTYDEIDDGEGTSREKADMHALQQYQHMPYKPKSQPDFLPNSNIDVIPFLELFNTDRSSNGILPFTAVLLFMNNGISELVAWTSVLAVVAHIILEEECPEGPKMEYDARRLRFPLPILQTVISIDDLNETRSIISKQPQTYCMILHEIIRNYIPNFPQMVHTRIISSTTQLPYPISSTSLQGRAKTKAVTEPEVKREESLPAHDLVIDLSDTESIPDTPKLKSTLNSWRKVVPRSARRKTQSSLTRFVSPTVDPEDTLRWSQGSSFSTSTYTAPGPLPKTQSIADIMAARAMIASPAPASSTSPTPAVAPATAFVAITTGRELAPDAMFSSGHNFMELRWTTGQKAGVKGLIAANAQLYDGTCCPEHKLMPPAYTIMSAFVEWQYYHMLNLRETASSKPMNNLGFSKTKVQPYYPYNINTRRVPQLSCPPVGTPATVVYKKSLHKKYLLCGPDKDRPQDKRRYFRALVIGNENRVIRILLGSRGIDAFLVTEQAQLGHGIAKYGSYTDRDGKKVFLWCKGQLEGTEIPREAIYVDNQVDHQVNTIYQPHELTPNLFDPERYCVAYQDSYGTIAKNAYKKWVSSKKPLPECSRWEVEEQLVTIGGTTIPRHGHRVSARLAMIESGNGGET